MTFLLPSPPSLLHLFHSLTNKGEKDEKNAAAEAEREREREGRERGTLSVKGKKTGGRAEQDRASHGRGVIMHHGTEGEH